MSKKRLSVTVDKDIYKAIEKIREEYDLSRSVVVNKLLGGSIPQKFKALQTEALDFNEWDENKEIEPT